MNKEFLVLKWDEIEKNLNDSELDILYGLLDKISYNSFNEHEYIVVNKEEPWIERIIELKKSRDREPWMSKKELLDKLRKCSEMTDSEEAHIEATVALIDYINDAEIDDAYSDVPLWFMQKAINEMLYDIKNRNKFNLEIMHTLNGYLLKHPEIRFIQALWNLGLVTRDENLNIEDRFYEESEETYKKLLEQGDL